MFCASVQFLPLTWTGQWALFNKRRTAFIWGLRPLALWSVYQPPIDLGQYSCRHSDLPSHIAQLINTDAVDVQTVAHSSHILTIYCVIDRSIHIQSPLNV